MDAEAAVRLGSEALRLALLVGGPLLAVSTLVGLVVGVLQATTQISEQSLLFVPKVVTVLAVALLLGPWMLARLVEFTVQLWSQMPAWVR